MAKLNQYLTVGEAAEMLGVSKDTLRRWDRAGKLEARRHPITGYRLYLKSELERLLAVLRSAAPKSGQSAPAAKKRRKKT